MVLQRRRWRRAGTHDTRLDHAPDEVPGARAALAAVLVAVAAWLLSAASLLEHRRALPVARRTLARWRSLLASNADRLQGALRTAVIERSEPQPFESLFPSGLSPPGDVRRRRWKDDDALYRLVGALTFLVRGAEALATSVTVLLAEARRRHDAPLLIAVA